MHKQENGRANISGLEFFINSESKNNDQIGQ